MQQITFELVLSFLNLIISSATLLLAFSLVVYILTHNLWSSVARTFATLMLFVSIVYSSDIILMTHKLSKDVTTAWLKFQWIGIAFVPAAYLHFSDALLRTTNASSQRRRILALASYGIGLLFVLMALLTDLIVAPPLNYQDWSPQLVAGQLFWLFALYFFLASAWGFANTLWARSRALTPTSRRRMSYLVASFAAPGLAVYPYLIFASLPTLLPSPLLLALLLLGNIGVTVMMTLMAYSVAYQGSLAPDRVVKRSFLVYLQHGPSLGLFVLLIILVVPRVEIVLGVPRETILIFAIVGGIIFYQLLLRFLRPLIDFLAYRDDRDELELLRSIDDRLLTSSDLQQLLENILTAVCDLQRIHNGAVVSVREGDDNTASVTLHPEVACGDKEKNKTFLARLDAKALLILADSYQPQSDDISTWIEEESYRLLPLGADDQENILGFLVVEPSDETQPLTERECTLIRQYIHQAEIGLQDRRLQQEVFSLLQQLMPQMEVLQEWRSMPPFPDATEAESADTEGATSPIHDKNFKKWVKDALGHYWGGPRLTESPLLNLNIVRAKLAEHDNNPPRALRAVLTEALDALKPAGQRQMTTQEWLLFNILDLKYIQRRRVRDVAIRLAMSESDLYRKQRAALDELTKALSHMEEEVRAKE